MANIDSRNSTDRALTARGNSRSALIIVGVLALLGLAYSIARVDILRARLVTLQMDQSVQRDNTAAASTRVTTLEENQRTLTSQLAQLQMELASTNEQVAVLRGGAALAQRVATRGEALYMLRMAQAQLQLAHDVPSAIESLSAAERVLDVDAANARIQQQVQHALAQLRALPNDAADIDQHLSDAEAQVAQLKLRGLIQNIEPTLPDSGPQRAWAMFKRGLASLFVIRATGASDSEVLDADEQLMRRRHLQVLLLNARMARHLADQPAYAVALRDAQTWLQQYFDGSSGAVTALVAQLNQLAQHNVAPAVPDLLPTIQALAQQLPKDTGDQPELSTSSAGRP